MTSLIISGPTTLRDEPAEQTSQSRQVSRVNQELGTVLEWGLASDIGLKRRGAVNQDQVYAAAVESGGVFAVADGMGGHAAGEIAAKLALDIFSKRVLGSSKSLFRRMIEAAAAANSAVFEQATGKRAGMGTTLTAAFISYDHVMLAHVGDSRAYLLRGRRMYRLTDDHSWVAEQVRLGELTPEQAQKHRWRNVVNNALGGEAQLRLEVFSVPLEAGDRLLLCTDGLHEPVSAEQLLRLLSLPYPPARIVRLLIDQANQNGGPDNVSAVVVDINAVRPSPKQLRWPARSANGPQPVQQLLGQSKQGSPVQALLLTNLYLVLIGMALLPLYRPIIAALGTASLLALLLLHRRSRFTGAEATALRPEASISLEDMQ